MVEEGRRDREPICGGVIKSHGGKRGGVHRSREDIQVSGAAARPVGRQLARGSPEYQEVAPILGPVRKATTKGGGGLVSVIHSLLRSDAGGVNLWGRNLGVICGNDKNTGFSKACDGKDNKATVGRELEEGGSGSVLKNTGTQKLGTYIEKQQNKVSEWIVLRLIYEVCDRETGYKVGGRRREPW